MSLNPRRLALVGAVALALGAPFAAPLVAQIAAKPGAADPARVTGGTYTVDHEHTMVGWRLDHLGVTPYFGIFGQVTGTLDIDPKNPRATKVDVTIPVAKVTTASPGLTAHLLRPAAQAGGKPDFFGPAPADARFVSTSVEPGEKAGTAKLTGNLTLNGVTKPVVLDVEFYGAAKMPKEMGGQDMIGFEADATIKRSDFGISAAIPLVSDEVQLDIVAAFVK